MWLTGLLNFGFEPQMILFFSYEIIQNLNLHCLNFFLLPNWLVSKPFFFLTDDLNYYKPLFFFRERYTDDNTCCSRKVF